MARQDDIRIGDTERDAVMVALHDHFAAGRLDRGELDERMDAVLSAKTRGDLRTLVRDLPAPTGLPEPDTRYSVWGDDPPGPPATALRPSPVPWGPGAAVMFGGPAGHPSWRHHHRHMARGRRHGPPFPAFPLLLGVFLVLTFTVGPGAGFLAVLQIALAIWVIRAIVLAFGARRSRRST